ncbi:MAG: UDP-N-acetylmuramoyl-L-alanyl-D-glutamate--2,6-diaminopimelate ligase [Sterolibacterium sp.]
MSAALQLLAELRRQGVAPGGIGADSRRIAPGDVFVALPGTRTDGRAFIHEAVARGAVAVLREDSGGNADEGEPASAVPTIAVANLASVCGELADLIYGHPSSRLWMVGVTGTNGKTSVSLWIAQAFTLLGSRCGVVGTLGSGFAGELADSPNTTPDVISLHRTLAGFVAAGADACAMEASSIGLDQGRTAAIAYDVAVFTNLTRDHLDYHASMEDYATAKRRLFEVAGLSAAILNLDDEFGTRLNRELAGQAVKRIGYSLRQQTASTCAEVVWAEHLELTDLGLCFTVHTAQGEARIVAPLLGRFNAANLLAVLASLLASGFPLERAAAVLPRLSPPPGRMQALGGDRRPLLVIDYAHTPDALEQVLTTLREVAAARGGQLICVFGCGGERDPGKRPLMGRVAARLADIAMVTSDNPRGEDPARIIADILRGMPRAVPVEADRARAIHAAVAAARQRDVVLIAGKGHEAYQEIAGRRLPFSDLEQANDSLANWREAA